MKARLLLSILSIGLLLIGLCVFIIHRAQVGTTTIEASLQTQQGLRFNVTRWVNMEFDHWHLDVIDGPTNIVTHAFLDRLLNDVKILPTANGKAVEVYGKNHSGERRLLAFFDLINRKLWIEDSTYRNRSVPADVLFTNLAALKAQCGLTE